MRVPDIATLLSDYAGGRVDPEHLVEDVLEGLAGTGRDLGAVVHLREEDARAAARTSAQRWRAGQARPLEGIPFGVKDNIQIEGVPVGFGSEAFAGHLGETTAEVVRRLIAAGAVPVAMLSTYEFACGPRVETANPHDRSRIAGGSSSGPAATVGGGLLPLALGTDTGGSVRVPASWCGAVGLKPTYGRVSRYGIAPLSWTLDHAGVITRTARDAALALDVLAGHDAKDPYSVPAASPGLLTEDDQRLPGLRVGRLRGWFTELVQPDVAAACERSEQWLLGQGAELVDVDVPLAATINPDSLKHVIVAAEAASYHESSPRPERYGATLRSVVESGSRLPAVDYLHALRVAGMLREQVSALFDRVDVLVAPTVAVVAPLLGNEVADLPGPPVGLGDVVARTTSVFNVSGHPSVTIPVGRDRNGMPIGVQVVAAHWQDVRCLAVGQRILDGSAEDPGSSPR
jgi:aspartyl-tRNA(Asn)/glutamyl-tRNA(Gln) amidotransferase subunit A